MNMYVKEDQLRFFFRNVCPFDCTTVTGNCTSWTAVLLYLTVTRRSAISTLIEHFGGDFDIAKMLFKFSSGIGDFAIRLNRISFFISMNKLKRRPELSLFMLSNATNQPKSTVYNLSPRSKMVP